MEHAKTLFAERLVGAKTAQAIYTPQSRQAVILCQLVLTFTAACTVRIWAGSASSSEVSVLDADFTADVPGVVIPFQTPVEFPVGQPLRITTSAGNVTVSGTGYLVGDAG